MDAVKRYFRSPAAVIGLILVVLFQRVFAKLQGNFAQEL